MKIYALSDIHGCLEELKEKLEMVDLSGDNKIVFLGDYIDYGPESGQLLHYLYDYQKKNGSDKVIMLKGNHEAMLLDWLDEYSKDKKIIYESMIFNSWLKTDSEQGFITLRTLVTHNQFEYFLGYSQSGDFDKMNKLAAKMVMETNGEIIRWIRSMGNYYETDDQIYVHAGINEEAEEDWKWGTDDDMFLWKYPPTTGRFYKTIIAGHVGTSNFVKDRSYHDVFYDGMCHYFIDGTVYRQGRLLLLAYDKENDKYICEKNSIWYEV